MRCAGHAHASRTYNPTLQAVARTSQEQLLLLDFLLGRHLFLAGVGAKWGVGAEPEKSRWCGSQRACLASSGEEDRSCCRVVRLMSARKEDETRRRCWKHPTVTCRWSWVGDEEENLCRDSLKLRVGFLSMLFVWIFEQVRLPTSPHVIRSHSSMLVSSSSTKSPSPMNSSAPKYLARPPAFSSSASSADGPKSVLPKVVALAVMGPGAATAVFKEKDFFFFF